MLGEERDPVDTPSQNGIGDIRVRGIRRDPASIETRIRVADEDDDFQDATTFRQISDSHAATGRRKDIAAVPSTKLPGPRLPFDYDPNDTPIQELQEAFNNKLATLMHPKVSPADGSNSIGRNTGHLSVDTLSQTDLPALIQGRVHVAMGRCT